MYQRKDENQGPGKDNTLSEQRKNKATDTCIFQISV